MRGYAVFQMGYLRLWRGRCHMVVAVTAWLNDLWHCSGVEGWTVVSGVALRERGCLGRPQDGCFHHAIV